MTMRLEMVKRQMQCDIQGGPETDTGPRRMCGTCWGYAKKVLTAEEIVALCANYPPAAAAYAYFGD